MIERQLSCCFPHEIGHIRGWKQDMHKNFQVFNQWRSLALIEIIRLKLSDWNSMNHNHWRYLFSSSARTFVFQWSPGVGSMVWPGQRTRTRTRKLLRVPLLDSWCCPRDTMLWAKEPGINMDQLPCISWRRNLLSSLECKTLVSRQRTVFSWFRGRNTTATTLKRSNQPCWCQPGSFQEYVCATGSIQQYFSSSFFLTRYFMNLCADMIAFPAPDSGARICQCLIFRICSFLHGCVMFLALLTISDMFDDD